MLQNEILEENFLQAVITLTFLLLISVIMIGGFVKKRFFKIPASSNLELKIGGKDVLRGFSYFLITELFVVQIIFILFYTSSLPINLLDKNSLNLSAVYGSAFVVSISYFKLKNNQKQALWNRYGFSYTQSIKSGLINLAIFYFPSILLGSLISILISYYFGQAPKNQQAIEFLKQSAENPIQLFLTIIAIVILAPFKEEFLFRGLLQSWLKQKTKQTSIAIVLTSLIFSLFHYAGSQELSNIPLFFSLFILSCGLGFIFEKEGSLLASIVMHAGFNITQLLLFFIY